MPSERIVMDILQERYELVIDRIRQIQGETFGQEVFEAYFKKVASFLLLLDDTKVFLENDGLKQAPLEELQARNEALYCDILPQAYEESYANPQVAVKRLGKEYGQELSWLYVKMRSLISDVYRGQLEDVVAGMELFAEVYAAFTYGAADGLIIEKMGQGNQGDSVLVFE